MPTLKCDLCDVTADGDTFEEWMVALKPHYQEAHADVVEKMGKLTEDEMLAEMQRWMTENQTRFDAAS